MNHSFGHADQKVHQGVLDGSLKSDILKKLEELKPKDL